MTPEDPFSVTISFKKSAHLGDRKRAIKEPKTVCVKKDAECYWQIKGLFNIIITQENTQLETISYMAFLANIGGL